MKSGSALSQRCSSSGLGTYWYVQGTFRYVTGRLSKKDSREKVRGGREGRVRGVVTSRQAFLSIPADYSQCQINIPVSSSEVWKPPKSRICNVKWTFRFKTFRKWLYVIVRDVGGHALCAYTKCGKTTFKVASPHGVIMSIHFVKKITPIYIYVYLSIYI